MRRYGKGTTDIRARVGETFVLELPAVETGGYTWRVMRQPGVAALREERVRPAGRTIGGGSVQEFEFTVTHAGEDVLGMVYGRSWEQTPVEQLQVRVVADP
jgi:predicted secreted protein